MWKHLDQAISMCFILVANCVGLGINIFDNTIESRLGCDVAYHITLHIPSFTLQFPIAWGYANLEI